MIVQVYAMISESDAIAVCRAGVDHVGIVTSKEGDPVRGIVSYKEASRIASIIREEGKKTTVILDTLDINEMKDSISTIKMDIIHLCSEVPLDDLKRIRDLTESMGVMLMYAIPISSEASIEVAKKVEDLVDFIMCDSPFESYQMKGFVGASGKTHDWGISKEIVLSVNKPVILAGGLTVTNVAQAIRIVKPKGVDAKTSLDLKESSGRKDIEKVEEFVRIVRSCEYTDNR